MSARAGRAAAVFLFAGAAAALAVGWVLLAGALVGGCMYLAGRVDRARDRDAVVAGLRAELDRADARIAALEDERDTHYADRRARRFAPGARLMPDNRGYRSPAALDRKPTTPAADRGLPAPSSATP